MAIIDYIFHQAWLELTVKDLEQMKKKQNRVIK